MKSQVTRRLKALFRALLQTVANNAVQRRGNIFAGSQQVGGIFLQNGAYSVGRAGTFEGSLSRQRLIQDRAQAENTGERIGFLSTYLLRRDIHGGAHHYSRAGL